MTVSAHSPEPFHKLFLRLAPHLDRDFASAQASLASLWADDQAAPRLTCALSGGPDSVLATLIAARAAQNAGGPMPQVFHLDHGLRPEAYQERLFCRDLAAGLGAPFFAWRLDPRRNLPPGPGENSAEKLAHWTAWQRLFNKNHPAEGQWPTGIHNESFKARFCGVPIPAKLQESGGSIEERGRLWRWFFIELIRPGNGQVVTGHNLTDWVEGFFLRLDRGGGPVVTLHAAHRVTPLGDMTKEQIVAWLKEYQVPYCIDSTNRSQAYRRNQFRIIAETEALKPKGIRQSRRLYANHQQEVDSLIYKAMSTHDQQFHDTWPTFDPAMPLLGLRTWLSEAIRSWTGKMTPIRAELPLRPLTSLDSTVRKYLVDSILAAWALPPLAGGLWTELTELLRTIDSLKTIPRQVWSNRYVSFACGGRRLAAYLVMRPRQPLWWRPAGPVAGPLLSTADMPVAGSLAGWSHRSLKLLAPSSRPAVVTAQGYVAYQKSLRVSVGGPVKKIANYLQELGVSRLDRPFIRLIASETPGQVVVGLDHIRPVWPNSGE